MKEHPALHTKKLRKKKNTIKNKGLYILALPGILYYIIFRFIPLPGIIIAFQKYSVFKGILKSDFVGFENFVRLFQTGDFWRLFSNTMIINFYDIVFGFFCPVVLSLMINEVSGLKFKKLVQSSVYFPHFLSWAVMGSIVTTQLLSLENGLINKLIVAMGGEAVYFMGTEKYARFIVILSGIWKEVGWNTIIYLAAITSINPELYEAAAIDGAGHLKRLFNITIPSILPTVMMLLLLRIGHFMDFGFERMQVFLNGTNIAKLDIFDTYNYRVGIGEGRYSYATAIGLFKALTGFILLYLSNTVSKKTTDNSLF